MVEVLACFDHVAGSLAEASKGLGFSDRPEMLRELGVEDAPGNAENEAAELRQFARA
jgi:hypothetical protein